jgi:hypothetical protein
MDEYLYKEVYVVGTDNMVSASGELVVCSSFEKLLDHLKTKNISINSDLRVIHGVLTSARSIPKDFKNKQPFIMLKDPDKENYGVLLDADGDSCDELGEEIEMTLASEDTAAFFFEIEHVYILYGYEMSLVMSVDEDDLDEDAIECCMEIGDAARKLNTEDD